MLAEVQEESMVQECLIISWIMRFICHIVLGYQLAVPIELPTLPDREAELISFIQSMLFVKNI